MSQTQENKQKLSICPSCHKELPQNENKVFCPYCGYNMTTPSEPENLFDEQTPEEPLSAASSKLDTGETTKFENHAPKEKTRKKWIIPCVVIAAIILIAGIIIPKHNPIATDAVNDLGFPNFGNGREQTNLYDQQIHHRQEFSDMTFVLPKEWSYLYSTDFDLLYQYTENDNMKYLGLKKYDRSIVNLDRPEESMHELIQSKAQDIMPTKTTDLRFKDFEADDHRALYACYSGITDSFALEDTPPSSDQFDIYHTVILGDAKIYSIMLMERSDDTETYIDDYLKSMLSVHLRIDLNDLISSLEEPSGLTDTQHEIFDSFMVNIRTLSVSREEMIAELEKDGYEPKDVEFVVDACNYDWSQNALYIAQYNRDDYWYSYERLVSTLAEYHKFTSEEVYYAMHNCKIDWNEQALTDAYTRLEYSPYSYQGLLRQLESEGFTSSEATYAVENCQADWMEQALKAAYSAIKYSPYSYQGLLERLERDGFTSSEATYAVENCGADWNDQALKAAYSCLEYSPYSYQGFLESLERDGFTSSETAYAMENCVVDWNEQALKAANHHLEGLAYSYQGLLESLESDGFTSSEATYAVENCGVDWMEQALKAANFQLERSAYSYQGLLESLEREGFTTSEATYAVENCGADWMEQALRAANHCLKYSSYSYQGLLAQLEKEGFTTSEATYAVENCQADWMEQALKAANSRLGSLACSYQGLLESLESDGFTTSEATYAVENCGADWMEQAIKYAERELEYSSDHSYKYIVASLKYAGFTNEQAEYGASKTCGK